MNITGYRDARYIDSNGEIFDVILQTDEGDIPFSYSPYDDAPASEWVRGNVDLSSVAPYVEPVLSLDELKAAKAREITAARWASETAPYYFEDKEASFDTSERSQIKIKDAIDGGIETYWKTAEGTWIYMTTADFINLITEYRLYVTDLFEREMQLLSSVASASSPEELDQIVW